jgi:hypothetical protein
MLFGWIMLRELNKNGLGVKRFLIRGAIFFEFKVGEEFPLHPQTVHGSHPESSPDRTQPCGPAGVRLT